MSEPIIRIWTWLNKPIFPPRNSNFSLLQELKSIIDRLNKPIWPPQNPDSSTQDDNETQVNPERDRRQKPDNSSSQPSTGDVRKLIEDALTNDQLSNLCQDNFSEVYKQFADGQTKTQRISLLIEYADCQKERLKLLTEIERINPNAYSHWQSTIGYMRSGD